MLLCGKGGAGRTIKCTNWCEVAAASKYWWDSGTVDVTHDTVMLVNISESKFQELPGTCQGTHLCGVRSAFRGGLAAHCMALTYDGFQNTTFVFRSKPFASRKMFCLELR